MVTLYVAEGVLTGMTGTVLLSYRENSVFSCQFSVLKFSVKANLRLGH